MTPLVVLAAAGGVSWLLRIAFVDLVPARRLPPRIRSALETGGPAAMAALLTSEFVHIGWDPAGLAAAAAGALAAAFVTYRYRNLALTAAVGIGVYALISSLI